MAKILIIDIETAPLSAYIWSLWDKGVSPDFLTSNWYCLSWSAKWLGSKEVMVDSLYRHPNLAKLIQDEDDRPILYSLLPLLNEADVVVAHNGNKFDIPKLYTRFLVNKISPPSPFQTVDTLKVLKKNFKFSSNRLDSVAKELTGTGKLERKKFPGFSLWKNCLAGVPEAWEEMEEYNVKDVSKLEEVYIRLLPWIDNHPNVALIGGNTDRPRCPKCGGEHINYRGYTYTGVGKYRRFCCADCGGWSRTRFTEVGSKEGKGILTNVPCIR